MEENRHFKQIWLKQPKMNKRPVQDESRSPSRLDGVQPRGSHSLGDISISSSPLEMNFVYPGGIHI